MNRAYLRVPKDLKPTKVGFVRLAPGFQPAGVLREMNLDEL